MANGEVASKPDPKTGTAKPLTAVYEVIIPVENPDLSFEPGLRGFAKIDGGPIRLGLVAGALVEQDLQLPALNAIGPRPPVISPNPAGEARPTCEKRNEFRSTPW